MARDDPHFRLRIPKDLKDQIEEAANAHQCSINAEIISRLYQTIQSLEQIGRQQDDFTSMMEKSIERGYDMIVEKIGILPDLQGAIDALIETQRDPKPGRMAVVRMLVRDRLAELGFYREPKLTRPEENSNSSE